jgi:hypothetical protein
VERLASTCSGLTSQVENGSFFAIFHLFQLRSTGYAPSNAKQQKISLFLPTAGDPEQARSDGRYHIV